MPRTQGKNIPRSGIAEKEWTVYENYEFGKSKVQLIDTLRDNQERAAAKIDLLHSYVEVDAIIKTGEQADSYSLSDIEIHETLLADFHEIYNRVDALNYVKRRGFLSSDFEPMREPNLPLNHGCLVEEVLDSAAYIRWLMSLSDSITSNKILKLDNYMDVTELESAVCIYLRDRNSKVFPFETRSNAWGYSPVRGEEEPLLYTNRQWKNFGAQRSKHVAQDYLRGALYRLLRGVQPILDWKQTLDGDLVLDQNMSIATPWQAISYAVLLNVTGKGHIVCCRNCTTPFPAKRQDKSFCKDSCNKAYNRKYGKTVHAYPKERGNDK